MNSKWNWNTANGADEGIPLLLEWEFPLWEHAFQLLELTQVKVDDHVPLIGGCLPAGTASANLVKKVA